MMRVRLAFAVAFFCVSLSAAAQTFVFDLSGAQEVPPVSTTATGGCYGSLDQGAATFAITCVHDVPNATVMHIHRSSGAIAFDMGDPSTSPVVATWTGLTPADISDLLSGTMYVNIHTAGRPSGEIRGTILPRTVDVVNFTADGSQVVPPNESSATATCSADLNNAATALDISCTHTLAGATAAHVHEAPFGINGPIVFTFPSAASPLSASMPMTPRLVADFAATFLYLDIHTPGGSEETPSEEIRGQIGTPPEGAGTGTVIITKETSPAGGTAFGFSETITNGNFALDDGQSQTFASVQPGVYTITEDDPAESEYTLAGISCADPDGSTDVGARTATVHVDAGETVRCTFTNLRTSPTDTIFVFHLSGDQEVPPATTTERGGCMGRFNAGTSSLSLVCVHDVALATVMHIHHNSGAIAFDLGEPASPVIATWSGISPADVAELLAGNLYVNIHTAGRPAGAIRGQILPRTVDTISFPLDATQVVPPGTSPATGNCTADLDATATGLALNCTHTMAGADAAHVHEAPRGFNGPAVFTFPSPASPMSAVMPMTPRLVADFAAYFLHVDVHSPDAEEGSDEIRGQIAPPVLEATTGTIRIRKATSPAGGTDFSFTETVSNGGFTLADGGEKVFSNVAVGTYTFTEATKSGWSLTDVSCSDGDSTGSPFARTATVNLQGGENVTCTFTNLQTVTAPTRYIWHLSGDQEVPPTNSAATGGCYAQLDNATRRFALVCTHNVSSPVVAHIHRGPAGGTGPAIFDLGDPSSPIEATWNMTPEDVADLAAGNLYLNIHASGRPEGEIRGQILPRTVDRIAFEMNGAQEVPPTDSPETGHCVSDLSDDASSLNVQCTHTVVAPTDIHLHDAPPGIDGPVIFDFPETSSFNSDVPLTPRLIADYAAGFLYVNVHSANYDTGEIRGQAAGAAAPAAVVGDIPTLSEWGMLMMAAVLALVAMRRAI